MRTKQLIIQTTALAMIIVLCFAVQAMWFSRKTVYVNLQEIYDRFEYSQSMQKKAEQTLTARTNIIDSLKYILEVEYRQLQSALDKSQEKRKEALVQFNQNRQEFLQKKQTFEKNNAEMLEQYDKQIWTQINKYIGDYGKEKGMGIIVGGNGDGNVMYSPGELDITEDIIAYINLKHKGV